MPTLWAETQPPSTVTVTVPAPQYETDTVTTRANATFVMLARNSDLEGALSAIRSIQDRFNMRHGYPFVFLNDHEFTDEFKRRMSVLTGFNTHFGVIPKEHWVQPDWIDEKKAEEGRRKLSQMRVKYSGATNCARYRNMCRFNSGFFFRHELLQPYRYYWRIEPNVRFHCDIHEDPFAFVEANKKVYGFTITAKEIKASIPTLWSTVQDFTQKNPQYIAKDNAERFISTNGVTYNGCHFWSNFEIADMDFWRSESYTAFFEHLDRTGGFYYERWGDAPVHSIAAALFLPRDQIHFFEEIGYQHDDWAHCPRDEDMWVRGRCTCDRTRSFDYADGSCTSQWDLATKDT
ncbi:glycosyltransferase family 15 protein [Cylindrobasidium torrendii FP15055 ss-10]|uniref:Glycosyltransferase family 15 protein n=1 Tax=Cylindrobasidium torrendii FP15055 ss-10 TaxID=1314674 RepID=A0A0D7BPW6_9AGAR|nr:glycosyltransferase family 15 protein [Cylindrobasidium torrendii FP15055 ss-10]